MKDGETTRLGFAARPSYVLAKLSWHPDLTASVDGQAVPVMAVTPGFAAFRIDAGEHSVVLRYQPGPLKLVLFLLGIGAFAGFAANGRTVERVENAAALRLAGLGARLDTPRLRTAAALAVLIVLAVRPLARGLLIDGHER
jgi:hypothetical protein